MIRRSGAVALAVLAGCSAPGPAFVPLPELPPETRSLIAAAFLDGAWRLQAEEVQPGQEVVVRLSDVPDGAWGAPNRALYLATYPHELEKLNLRAGRLIEGTAESTRALPAPMHLYGLESDRLRPLQALPDGLKRLRVGLEVDAVPDDRAVIEVGVGMDYTCALRADGRVSCWGDNDAGQVGGSNPRRVPQPFELSDVDHLRHLAVGADTVCGLDFTGSVICWGENSSGQLGRKESRSGDPPRPVAGIDDAVGVAAQWSHFCAVRASGEVWCWGGNTGGASNPASSTDVNEPSKVEGLPPCRQVVTGIGHSCGLTALGEVWCWGGESAPPGTGTSGPSPAPVPGLSGAVELASGSSHLCARLADGSISCWGAGTIGQLGNPERTSSQIPVRSSLSAYSGRLVAGASASCVLSTSGARCLGGSTASHLPSEPLEHLPDDTFFVAMGSGAHACAATKSGLFCWGRADSGQLGVIPIPRQASPVDLPGVTDGRSVAASRGASCVTRRGGEIVCFGSNRTGFFPGLASESQPEPASFELEVGELAMGASHNCVRTSTPAGAIYCWGSNSTGQLGIGTTIDARRPQLVQSQFPATKLAASELVTCAIFSNGELRCWGSNRYFMLGVSATEEYIIRSSPERVDLPLATHVAIGAEHGCAVAGTDRGVYCWGENLDGQLGTGSMGRRPLPDRARDIVGAVEVAAGHRHTCARLDDGSISCWGRNSDGQTGAPMGTPRVWEAARVPPFDDATSLSVGLGHTCVLRRSGSVWCFGLNDFGQLGDGTFESRSDPEPVPGVDAISMATGASHTCVVRRDGRVSCWGADGEGQLGIGTRTVFEEPVEVTTLR
ncbi:MAG: hypothetical protein HY791_21560 [Deltaproteobacteria bacterium]|nr:hypothetical protein [Deltaproteobacteria bacterium]